MIDQIWFIPPDAAMAALPSALTAQNQEQFSHAVQPAADLNLRVSDEYRKTPRKEGIGSRVVDLLMLVLLKLSGIKPPDPATMIQTDIFPLQMMVAETHETSDLPMTTDEAFALTAALRDRVGAIISADRGFGPMRVELPHNALDFLDEGRSLSDEEAAIFELSNITAYWPPVAGKLGLALHEEQEDGGLPIVIFLLAQDASGHDEATTLLERWGGGLKQT